MVIVTGYYPLITKILYINLILKKPQNKIGYVELF